MPAKKEWLTFAEWGRKWGKPFSAKRPSSLSSYVFSKAGYVQ